MTNKKQNKVIATSKAKKQETKVNVQPKQEKSKKAPNCSVNFVVIENFEGTMRTLGLNRDSKVNDIMLKLYAAYGTNLNQNTTAKQIRDFKNVDKKPEDKDFCKISAGCISWYKNHYRPEQNKFVSTKKKSMTKEELLDKLYAIDELKSVHDLLPAINLTKLKEIATKYELV